MVVATSAVVGCPIVAVLALRASGAITSTIALSLIAVALSVAASFAGEGLWKRRAASGDLVFGDLMVWGWLGRWRSERLLSRTASLVGPGQGASGDARRLSRERRARLLERLSRALEARDPHTHGHSRRVARHAAAIAKRMGLPPKEVARVRTAAILHDVGKIDTPKELIDKRGPLTAAEYEVVKQHAPVGAQMVASLEDPELTALVRHHHERLDGGGYPDGLAGVQIPLGARIIAVADTFDAVTSARPYRRAMAHKQALALLDAEAGTQLDPDVVRSFHRYYSGHWPVAFWAAILALPRQAGFLLFDQLRFGSALTTAKVAAASLATVAVGTTLVQPAQPVQQQAGDGNRTALPTPTVDRTDGSAPTASTPSRSRGGKGNGNDAVRVSSPNVVTAPAPTESSSSPGTGGGQQGSGSSPTSSGGESNSGGGTTSSSPAPSPAATPSTTESQTPQSPPTAPVEPAPTTPPPTIASTVNSTLEGVGATVNQVTSSPTVTGVGNVVNQVTGGILGAR